MVLGLPSMTGGPDPDKRDRPTGLVADRAWAGPVAYACRR
jgi:hypothetical protein